MRVALDAERRVTIHARGALLRQTRLPKMRAACGMITTGDEDDWWNPALLGVYADPATDTVVLDYGLSYDSCMCDYVDRQYRSLRVRH